jgi:N-acetyl-D-muramate 6-phosphate phosphatase
MTLDLQRIRALCFDLDGTLSDTDDLWVSRLESLLRPARFLFRKGETYSAARWLVMGMETPGNLLYSLLDWMNLDDEMGHMFNYLARQTDKQKKSFWMIPEIDRMLQHLGNQYPMSVVSARDQCSTTAFLDHFELSPFFQAVATSQTCQYTKPFPHPVKWAADQMGISPRECVMIGDTVVDIRAGKAAGAQTVGVLCGFGTEKELRRAGADLIIPTTGELVNILGGKLHFNPQ